MRDRLFSAVRSLVEAACRQQAAGHRDRGHPLGGRGNARPDRVPGALGARPGADRLPGPRRAARPPARLGRRPPQRDHDRARAADAGRDARARRGAAARAATGGNGHAELVAPGRRALGRQPAVRRGDGQPDPARRARRTSRRLPETVHAVLAARLDSLAPPERRVLQHASVVGQTFWEGSLRAAGPRRASTSPRRSARCRRRTWSCRAAGSRLAGEHEYAFKHVLIRDVAYSTLPKSVRARKHAEVGGVHRGARRRPLRGRRRRWSPTTTARAAALGADAGLERGRARADQRARPLEALEAAGDAAAALYSNQEALGHYETALSLGRDARTRTRVRGSREKLGDVALRLGRVDQATEVWERVPRLPPPARRTSRGSATCTARSAPALWHKGDREGSIEHYQSGIDLLKDGPPCLELVRLYEEAASLYMHTGDNMLAIYASEKALRLAERLGEAAAASRAHGIFGRVFGRIGDSERARENLERSVELARESDPGRGGPRAAHARLPPRGLRGRLRRAPAPPTGGARARRADRRPALAGRAARRARRSSPSTAATGRPSRRRPRPPRRSPSARA